MNVHDGEQPYICLLPNNNAWLAGILTYPVILLYTNIQAVIAVLAFHCQTSCLTIRSISEIQTCVAQSKMARGPGVLTALWQLPVRLAISYSPSARAPGGQCHTLFPLFCTS